MAAVAEFALAQRFSTMRDLLASSTYWQAIVADPLASYPDIKTAVGAGGLSQANAYAAIAGDTLLDDEIENDDKLNPPRIIYRYMSDAVQERNTFTTHSTTGQISILIEIPVATEFQGLTRAMVWGGAVDFFSKVGAMVDQWKTAITSTATSSSYPTINSWTLGPIGLIDPDDTNGVYLRQLELFAEYQGSC